MRKNWQSLFDQRINFDSTNAVYAASGTNSLRKKELVDRESPIRRVRFKPGYQAIWRKSRNDLQELLCLRYSYQKKLTNYLVRFYRLAHFDTDNAHDISLKKVLLVSKLLPDYGSIMTFSDKRLVYLNGHIPPNLEIIAVEGDFVQLVVSD
jgi:hypothetical protein